MSLEHEPICRTPGCPWPSDPDMHIPWCQAIKGHRCFGGPTHQHWPKKGMGGHNPDSKIVACLCAGMHDAVDNGVKYGNAVIVDGEGRKVYRLWEVTIEPPGKTLIERVIEPAQEPNKVAGDLALDLSKDEMVNALPPRTLPAIQEGPSARGQLAAASAKGRQALELATSVGEVKHIRDQAEALRMYAQAVHLGLEAQNEMADIKIRAERKGGELLEQMLHTDDLHDVSVSLAGLGIQEVQSHRWQIEASVPDLEYEAYAQTCQEEGCELTSAGLLRLAYALLRQDRNITTLDDLPDGIFRTIVVDPPWPMAKIEREVRPLQGPVLDYLTMSLEDIASLPIGAKAAPDGCHLYLWTTQKFLPDALKIAEGWGFKYQCLLTWVKNVGITPYSWMYSTEHVIFARLGSLDLLRLGVRLDFNASVREHSRKPDEFYEIVRMVSPVPRADIFSREERHGFTGFGDEISKFAAVAD